MSYERLTFFCCTGMPFTSSRVASVRHPRILVLPPRLEALHACCDDRAVLNSIPIAEPTVHEKLPRIHGHPARPFTAGIALGFRL